MSETFMICHVSRKKDIEAYKTVPCNVITKCIKQTQREGEFSMRIAFYFGCQLANQVVQGYSK